ncbi:permease [Bifidobacterium sp.]|jgi:uncharacterized membrane protein YraQ (UPF0718 family)|uniref:permease n=1 Tax=Bifidobacterium sp. TaxID=41200 RepID=UPI0025BB40C6|nr:permease [Bifidobacterium sp.]MCI1635480.1 permease [Bifidobacterium sp.]
MRSRFQFSFQTFLLGIFLVGGIIVASPLIDTSGFPMTIILTGVVGLLLQALPFLLIGILISAAVETFVTQEFIEAHFPKSTVLGMLVALFAGFCIPVCDCATVPVFSRLHSKGVPLPAAIVFLCAAPVINPIVIWSTWFAFPDSPLMTISRVSFGVLVALLVGISFVIVPANHQLLRDIESDSTMRITTHATAPLSAVDNCGVCVNTPDVACTHHALHSDNHVKESTHSNFSNHARNYLQHIHDDLYTILPYMMMGIVVASSVRAFAGSSAPSWLQGYGTPVAIIAMMALAFLSSLCSSSDAVIARSISTLFPTPAILGFLVFGPIMDLKNVLMLRSMFTRRFVWRLGITVSIICFSLMLIVAAIQGVIG